MILFQGANKSEKQRLKEAIWLQVGKPKNLTQFIEWVVENKFPFWAYPDTWATPKGRPSKVHLFHYIENLYDFSTKFAPGVTHNKSVQQAFIAVYKKEIAERAKGNYVFYHGQCWSSGFYQDIYKQLWNVTDIHQVGNDFTFFRFDQKMRVQDARKDSLFVNYALFSNLTRYGNSSAYYFLMNTNCHPHAFTIIDLFAKFNLANYGKKYQSDFQVLQKMYREASQYGTMFLISIPPDKLYNVHNTVEKGEASSVMINGKETFDTKTIYDALLDNPQSIKQVTGETFGMDLPSQRIRNADTLEFAIPLTIKYALDPYSGPRIYSFNATDHENCKHTSICGTNCLPKLKQTSTQPSPRLRRGVQLIVRSSRKKQQATVR